jgi:hypothetical protein
MSEEPSVRVELAALMKSESTEYANGFNTALNEVIKILDRYDQERLRRSARVIAQRQKEGLRIGGDVPYGKRVAPDGETLCEALDEQRVIKIARKLRASGLSLREIARKLLAEGMRPREGTKFHAAQIKRLTDEES